MEETFGECLRRKQGSKLSLHDLVQPLLALKELRLFDLRRSNLCSGISDDAIRCISESFPYLRTLNLCIVNTSGDRPSLRALYYLVRNCPDLKKLALPHLLHREKDWDAAPLRQHGLEELVRREWEVDERSLDECLAAECLAAVFPKLSKIVK